MRKINGIPTRVDPEFKEGLKRLCTKIEKDFGIKKYSEAKAMREILTPFIEKCELELERKKRNKNLRVNIKLRK